LFALQNSFSETILHSRATLKGKVMTKRIIRQADEGDVATLAQIRNDALAYKLSRGDFAWGRNEWTEAVARQTLERGGMHVIEQDNIPAAIMSLSWEDDKRWGSQELGAGYVHGLSVRNGFHGLGLGSYALNWCADHVGANSRHYVRLDCDMRNAALCAYYENLGFICVGTRQLFADYFASFYERPVR
jgi:ribosomal protein S18 acetylase RimI-like enzyme